MITKYIQDLHETLDKISVKEIENVVKVLHKARMEHRNIYVLGNGGSASTASHMVCDLAKNTKNNNAPHICIRELMDNTTVLSAYANDDGYHYALAFHLQNFLAPKDIVIAISTSGKSANIFNAVQFARSVKAKIIGFTGFTGGELKELADYNIYVPSYNIGIVEDCHLIVSHILTEELRRLAESER